MRTGAELEGLQAAATGTREVARGLGEQGAHIRDLLGRLSAAAGLEAPRRACADAADEVSGFLRATRGEALVLTDGAVAQERLLRAAGDR